MNPRRCTTSFYIVKSFFIFKLFHHHKVLYFNSRVEEYNDCGMLREALKSKIVNGKSKRNCGMFARLQKKASSYQEWAALEKSEKYEELFIIGVALQFLERCLKFTANFSHILQSSIFNTDSLEMTSALCVAGLRQLLLYLKYFTANNSSVFSFQLVKFRIVQDTKYYIRQMSERRRDEKRHMAHGSLFISLIFPLQTWNICIVWIDRYISMYIFLWWWFFRMKSSPI